MYSMNTTTNSTDNPTSQNLLWRNVLVVLVFMLILICGIFGNALVILAVILSRKLRTFTNIYVVNQSISDLASNIFILLYLINFGINIGKDSGIILCNIAGLAIIISVQCSTLNIAAIGLNRYILITHPTHSNSKFKKFFASPITNTIIVAATWIVPIVIDLVPTFVGSFGDELPGKSRLPNCMFYQWPASPIHSYLVGISVLIPLLMTIIWYALILKFVLRHFRNQKESLVGGTNSMDIAEKGQSMHRISELDQQQHEITKNLFVVVVVFSILVMPSAVARFFPEATLAMLITGIFIIASGALNPIIYLRKHPHFRVVLIAMLKCRYRDIPEKSRFLERMTRSTSF